MDSAEELGFLFEMVDKGPKIKREKDLEQSPCRMAISPLIFLEMGVVMAKSEALGQLRFGLGTTYCRERPNKACASRRWSTDEYCVVSIFQIKR
jgi:hypothetical protein